MQNLSSIVVNHESYQLCGATFLSVSLPQTFQDFPILRIDTCELKYAKLNRLLAEKYRVDKLWFYRRFHICYTPRIVFLCTFLPLNTLVFFISFLGEFRFLYALLSLLFFLCSLLSDRETCCLFLRRYFRHVFHAISVLATL